MTSGRLVSGLHRIVERTPEHRDRHVDLLRAVAICAVVLGHWFLIAVRHHPDAGIGGGSALADLTWAHPLTWLFQVMPVFFLVGGYANGASLTAHHRRGGDPTSWLLGRTNRLLRPTTALLLTLGAGALLATLAGADEWTIGSATWLASIPLWFLAVYLAMVALAPITHAIHRRAGLAVPVILVALVGVLDLARLGLGVPAVGEANYLLGWLAIHQLGYCWRDGLLPARAVPAAAMALIGAVALVTLTAFPFSPYPVSMVAVPGAEVQNTGPPTLALMALALTQAGLALLFDAPSNRWLRRARPWMVVVGINLVVLTVFLWHMTAAVVGAALLYPTGILPQPPVDSPAWLLWRIPWVAALLVVLAALVAVFGRIEIRTPAAGAIRPRGPAWAGSTLTVLGLGSVLAGLMGIALAGQDYHGPAGLPTFTLLCYFAGAAVLRLTQARAPERSGRAS